MGRIACCFNYVVRERNPILQIVYLVVISGAFLLFMFYVWPYFGMFERDRKLNGGRNNKVYYMLSGLHIPISIVVMVSCIASWWLCCWADPGKITPKNHFLYYSMFPFGPIFSWNDIECKTCGHLKVQCGAPMRCTFTMTLDLRPNMISIHSSHRMLYQISYRMSLWTVHSL